MIKLHIAALVGEVAGEHHHIGITGIDFGHGLAQFAVIGIARRDVDVAQNGNFLRRSRHTGQCGKCQHSQQ